MSKTEPGQMTLRAIERHIRGRIKRLNERLVSNNLDLITTAAVRMSLVELDKVASIIDDHRVSEIRRQHLADMAAAIKRKAGL